MICVILHENLFYYIVRTGHSLVPYKKYSARFLAKYFGWPILIGHDNQSFRPGNKFLGIHVSQ